MLRYLAERLVSEEPPQAALSRQLPHVLSALLKTSLAVRSSSVPFHKICECLALGQSFWGSRSGPTKHNIQMM